MPFIDQQALQNRSDVIREEYQSKKPFRYVVIDHFLHSTAAAQLWQAYPKITDGVWDSTTYINQQNKFQKTKFDAGDVFEAVFRELNASWFTDWLHGITGIEEPLLADESLFGGGLHQSTNGAFLNVHVDYNMHPVTNYHRRLNVLVYLNKDWQQHYGGYLELWDLTTGSARIMTEIAPEFNRCVIFETNEISFHGHPKKLNLPEGVTRKSLATYYYTQTRPATETAEAHNTKFMNTEGLSGQIKRFKSGVKAALERINKQL